CMQGLEFPWMF
nr:immunoglobulin light chain junction region [Macaca mulatta]